MVSPSGRDWQRSKQFTRTIVETVEGPSRPSKEGRTTLNEGSDISRRDPSTIGQGSENPSVRPVYSGPRLPHVGPSTASATADGGIAQD